MLFATAALFGAFRPFMKNGLPLDALVMLSLIFFWCRFHASARNASLPAWNSMLIVALAIVGVPVYFFRTMPRREAFWATVRAAGVFVALIFVGALCTVIARRVAT
jgi:hypothetical protein